MDINGYNCIWYGGCRAHSQYIQSTAFLYYTIEETLEMKNTLLISASKSKYTCINLTKSN